MPRCRSISLFLRQWVPFRSLPRAPSSQSWRLLEPYLLLQHVHQHVLRTEEVLQKKLTITLDERVYAGLHSIVGRRRISRFIESLVRPHVLGKDLEAAYKQMAREEVCEAEALEWAEGTIADVADETRCLVGQL